MAARIIHFGADDCKRLLILRAAGFAVDDCKSLAALRSALHKEEQIAAVLVSEGRECYYPEAVTLIRSRSPAPLVLFQSMADSCNLSHFDLVIPALTHPRDWLHQVNEVIVQALPSREDANSSARVQSENRARSRNGLNSDSSAASEHRDSDVAASPLPRPSRPSSTAADGMETPPIERKRAVQALPHPEGLLPTTRKKA